MGTCVITCTLYQCGLPFQPCAEKFDFGMRRRAFGLVGELMRRLGAQAPIRQDCDAPSFDAAPDQRSFGHADPLTGPGGLQYGVLVVENQILGRGRPGMTEQAHPALPAAHVTVRQAGDDLGQIVASCHRFGVQTSPSWSLRISPDTEIKGG